MMTVLASGAPVICNDVNQEPSLDPWRDFVRDADFQAFAVFPLRVGGEVLGAFAVFAPDIGVFDATEVDTLTAIAAEIAFGLENIGRVQALETAGAVIDSSPVVLFRWRAATGWKVDFVSRNVAQWGYRADGFLSGALDYESVIHPEYLPRIRQDGEKAFGLGQQNLEQEFRIRTADGEIRWVSARIRHVAPTDPTADADVFEGTLTDITDRHRIQVALRDSESNLRHVLNHVPELIFVNRDDRIRYVNPKGAELLRADSVDDVLGRSTYDLFDPVAHTTVRDRIAQLRFRPGSSVPAYDEPMRALDGTPLDMSAMAVSYLVDGEVEILVTCPEISDKRRSEALSADHLKRLEDTVLGTARAMSQLVELRDPYTAGHERRVGELAAAIAAEMGLDEQFQYGLRVAGSLHDVGKIMVPVEILTKPSRLSAVEFELVKAHAEQGYQVLRNVHFPWPVAEVARQHHERLDGSGYPQGLKGDEIILEARITAVADVVESMSSDRPYRPSLGFEPALAEIERGAGTRYDPDAVAACLRLIRDRQYRLPP